ncbi:hypothetical protein K437DRAFT_282081 [Tilletiaria anomala UBC 951]|uniref:DASH complex subunit DAD2 n=1 Tax=Tilletiaria anomala (strain ATCC 24038 / CBS 436.72 / UBC 951) TaxID=1037660 RepID=A0A066VE29_TILAU|nr:uncharacterized protein K437DRAFT_282081 [Tilletiaria anomala UBC 951]KDN37014.1 hypothetical protein K437DRAFT_282081 [Tilletiaria anomala UBC 951]
MASSRPSVYPSASLASTNAASGSAPSSTTAQRLAAKHAELDGLRVLKEQSSRLAREIEKLGDRVDGLVEGGDAFASVMSSWQGVFRAIQISRADMTSLAASTAALVSGGVAAPGTGGSSLAGSAAAGLGAMDDEQVKVGTLVRIPVDTDASVAAAGEEAAREAKEEE